MLVKDIFLVLFMNLVLVVSVLVGVAFLTLMERKVLGYINIRKGPNQVGFLGIFQPFGDAVKLFSKEQNFPIVSNISIYLFSPIISLFLSLFIWVCMPFISMNMNFSLSVLYFLSLSSLGVYLIMLAGWSSNSSYAMLGGLRSVAQTISYEVSLFLILMSFLLMICSFDIVMFMKYQEVVWFVFLFIPMSIMWLVTILAETNRSPFDFAEGESELVSGFNVEYSSGNFAMIFLAEYSSIMFMSMMCGVVFLGLNFLTILMFMKIVFMIFLWVWVRGTLPRYRYDKLMYLAWKCYLPVSLMFLYFYLGVSMVVIL
uniref:NADH-ubiquinone oxidoreductase chain 1 n=1 Tax=Coleoptera sp. 1 AH-2016 TaxID=1903823 RepID=A0A343C2F1_9COLE|nr:NADH dehydrogenase subunit 1 [Coleoptera sp. 1 AH-2016]